jgi:hypothetical protein
MTSSHDWDSGSPESPTQGQHSAGTDLIDGPGASDSSGAKDRAQRAAGTAKDEGAHVAETARSEAQQVAGEAKDKAADLLSEAKTQVDQQSRSQLQALATKLEDLSSEVDSMVEGSNVQGTVTELARQLSDRTRALSSKLNEREPKDLLEDVRSFARQRPGTFLIGALAAGMVAGRLTRGVKKANDESSGGGTAAPASQSTGSTAPSPVGSAGNPATAGDLSNGSAVAGLGGDQTVPAGQNVGGRS